MKVFQRIIEKTSNISYLNLTQEPFLETIQVLYIYKKTEQIKTNPDQVHMKHGESSSEKLW